MTTDHASSINQLCRHLNYQLAGYAISEPDGADGNVPGTTVHGWYPA